MSNADVINATTAAAAPVIPPTDPVQVVRVWEEPSATRARGQTEYLVQLGGTHPDGWMTTTAASHRHAAAWAAVVSTKHLEPMRQATPVRAEIYVADARPYNRHPNGAPKVVIQCLCDVGGPA